MKAGEAGMGVGDAAAGDAAALRVDDLVAGYAAGLPVVQGVSLELRAGEVVAIVGPNGAGKSTLVKALAGVAPTFAGRVRLLGRDAAGAPAHERVALGLGYVPQVANVFVTLSVEENLRVGAHLLPRSAMRGRLDAAYARFPDLAAHRRDPAQTLSGGQRQMLAIARALMVQPRVLLLDEPSAGLAPVLVRQVFDEVRRIADQFRLAVLMVEQNVKAALATADRGVVMVGGRVALAGSAAALRDDATLPQLFLGSRGPGAMMPAASTGPRGAVAATGGRPA